ncbi:hypothetical protein TNCV_1790181 [Trichonephila clavipes]|nr:hypothetical protein TNCV_1790181 [Trichonephila clavipes]
MKYSGLIIMLKSIDPEFKTVKFPKAVTGLEKVISNGIDTPVGNGLSQKESHQIHSRTFLAVSPGLATVCAASPHFDHDLFRTIWSYVIHFPSPVTIRLRNDSISFRLARSSQMEIRSIMFFGVNW